MAENEIGSALTGLTTQQINDSHLMHLLGQDPDSPLAPGTNPVHGSFQKGFKCPHRLNSLTL